jgi:hypothetical protein
MVITKNTNLTPRSRKRLPLGFNLFEQPYPISCNKVVTISDAQQFLPKCVLTKDGRSVERYFFTIRGQDRVEDDPDGRYLPDVAAALSYAECTIRELRKKSGFNDPTLMMVVQDLAGQTVLSLPFFPGS